MKSFTFWQITLCRPLEVSLMFGRTCRHPHLATHFMLVSLTMKMEAAFSSETSFDL
jgi:hypothetical protein